MTITPSPLTNGASWPRTLKPTVLLCCHITANMGTAAQQVHYANRPGSGGPSAHDYLDPDGSGHEALVPAKVCAWSNGDVQSPNLHIATVAAAVKAGINPNKIVYREVECVGDGKHPVTPAQLAQLARFVAADAKTTGLPINRSTVTTHADWNSVTRNNCAFPPSVREARLATIIAQANAILHGTPAPAPQGDPMGLGVRLLATADKTPLGDFGTAKISGSGHAIIRVRDAARHSIAAGFDLGVVQRGVLTAPLDTNSGNRTDVVVTNVDGELYVALASDVTFTALPTPADATPFSQADLDAAKTATKAKAIAAVSAI